MQEDRPDVDRLIELQKFLLDFRSIERGIHLPIKGKMVRENDVEHSYFLAMMAWFLSPHFPELDRDLLIRTALVHDLVEVYAGDTYIFADKARLGSKEKREQQAYDRIRAEWPDFPQMNKIIEDYEAKISDETKFIYALDKLIPEIVNLINGGYTWKTENISLDKLLETKRDKLKLSEGIDRYYEEICKILKRNEASLFPS
ncbi:MAG TPA: HD domain-containing protein [Candidatus Sulfotelmatobacter sp.]|nr:HD domain-containing protein [Candidatus Sulfotelmatobacter sp.]